MRDQGWRVCVVEKWIPQMRRRVDAFFFGDLLGFNPAAKGAMLVQSTTDSHISVRVDKILAIPDALGWLKCGNQIEVQGWSKKGPRGKRKTWTVRRIPITVDMFSNGSDRQ